MRSDPVLAPHTTTEGVGCGSAVCVGVVDVAGLSEQGLRAQLQLVGRGESRLAAMKAQILGELGRRTSAIDAQLIASDELLSSKREAKRDVETATRLQQLPDTSNALADGEIPAGHARLIARASGEGPVDETVLVKAARTQNYDRFAKTVNVINKTSQVTTGRHCWNANGNAVQHGYSKVPKPGCSCCQPSSIESQAPVSPQH